MTPQEKRRRVMLRNVGTGLCLSPIGTTVDGAPVRQAVCDPADGLPIRSINRQGDKGTAGIFTGDNMYLGLKEWAAAGRGEPHDPLIATTRHYYLSPSLPFPHRLVTRPHPFRRGRCPAAFRTPGGGPGPGRARLRAFLTRPRAG
ncbi:hypothetical protein [Streptomyces sp. NBC_01216]|uniref:hypothetical protein n=1 Tax=unclassified Streptomyces TaxID=2593676 RepID=UPI002E140C1C|nr:hypothetical protein OG393_14595 [Streptomyces sp. NBC_01216]